MIITPDWTLADRVGAMVTTRAGGVSRAPYEHFNLAMHVGEAASVVEQNRSRLSGHLPEETRIQWLRQVHGTWVVSVAAGQPETTLAELEGDAVYIDEPGVAGAVLTADCLPVFLAAENGKEVAVAHAGWRGLQAGVLEAALGCFKAPASSLHAWLGPAIGPCHFEVGEEVRRAFLDVCETGEQRDLLADCAFSQGVAAGKWMADLYAIARYRLGRAGVGPVLGGDFCTFCDPRFYSYRREAVTGRMASLIYLKP